MSTITIDFKNGDSVVFGEKEVEFNLANGAGTMSRAQFVEFLPVAQCAAHSGSMIGTVGPAQGSSRKPGRPRGSKSTSAKKAVRKSVAK